MEITTKYNVGDKVIIINYDKPIEVTVNRIEITCHRKFKSIYYHFVTRKSTSSLDKDMEVTREEGSVYSSIEKMAEDFKSRIELCKEHIKN